MACRQAVKPPMPLRGNCNAAVLKYVYQSCVLSVAVAIGYHFVYVRPHRMEYRNFYKQYDAEAAFTRMVKRGDYFTHLEPCP